MHSDDGSNYSKVSILLCTLQNNFIDSKTAPNHGRYCTWKVHLIVKIPSKKEMIPLISHRTPLQSNQLSPMWMPQLIVVLDAVVWQVWIIQRWPFLCAADCPKSIPSSIVPISSRILLLVDCCFAPTWCHYKSSPSQPMGSRCLRAKHLNSGWW